MMFRRWWCICQRRWRQSPGCTHIQPPGAPKECITRVPKSRGFIQGWAGMTFGTSGTGMDNSIPKVREREGNWKNPFPQFRNGKGMKKNHSQNSGMGREWKNLFPKFGNGKGMKKIHSHNSGTGREWKKSIPTIREWESEAIIPKNTREREQE